MAKLYSEIDLAFVKDYLRVDSAFTIDDGVIQQHMATADDYVLNQFDKTALELDAEPRAVGVYLRVVKELYLGHGVTKDGKLDVAFDILQSSLQSGKVL